MAEQVEQVRAADVAIGSRIRTADGVELLVSRVEHNFLGREAMLAFIEDTDQRWLKKPVMNDAEVEVLAVPSA